MTHEARLLSSRLLPALLATPAAHRHRRRLCHVKSHINAKPMDVLILPAVAFAAVFQAVPLDARLRCREVSPLWRAALDATPALWNCVDFSDASGVTAHVSPALLRAAARRAGGAAVSLDLCIAKTNNGLRSGASAATDQRLSVKLAHVLSFLKSNKTHLRRMSLTFLWLRYPEEPGWPLEWAHYELSLEDTRALALAAPHAVIECSLSAVVTDTSFTTQRGEDGEDGEDGEPPQHWAASTALIMALFRAQPPFANVRLRSVNLSGFNFRGDETQAFCAFCAGMAQHRWLTDIRFHGGFYCTVMARRPEEGDRALSAFVDAALTLPALRHVTLCYMTLPRAPLPQLARLLRGAVALESFEYTIHSMPGQHGSADMLQGDGVPEFCDAIEVAPRLAQLKFHFGVNCESTADFHDASAGTALLAAARASPMLRCVRVNNITHDT